MDPATLIGLLLVLIGVFVGSLLKGVGPAVFFSVPAAFLIVLVATFGAAFMGSTIDDVKGVVRLFVKGMKGHRGEDPNAAIDQIVAFADRARKDGLLALEEDVDGVRDPFLRRGLQLAIDGADPEVVRDIMEAEISSMQQRHRAGAKFMTNLGTYAPTFGIIGAVVGLIATLGKIDDPEQLGHGIAAAFIATFWGVFLANGIFLPLANKLTRMSNEEVAHRQLIVDGVLNIQSGFNPRMLGDLMRSYLPPAKRPPEERRSA